MNDYETTITKLDSIIGSIEADLVNENADIQNLIDEGLNKLREARELAESHAADRLDIVGTAEAADLLDVERPRIGRWIKQGKMPHPAAVLAATPVWHRKDILAMKPWVDAGRRNRS